MAKPYLSGTEEDQPADERALPAKRVLMFLATGFVDSEAASALDICGWTHYRPSIATVSVECTGFYEAVTGAFGLCLPIDEPIERIDPKRYDALIVPGGFHNLGYDEAYDSRVHALARTLRDAGKPIATMCVGILPIAEAGLLEGGIAATYALSSRHDNRGRLREFGCQPSDEAVVDWNGIISCAGPAYSDQVMYALMRRLIGDEAAAEVERYRRGLA